MNRFQPPFPEPDSDDILSKRIKLTVGVKFPDGEEHTVEAFLPIISVLTEPEVMGFEYMKLVDFLGHDAGIMAPRKHFAIVTRDDFRETDSNDEKN